MRRAGWLATLSLTLIACGGGDDPAGQECATIDDGRCHENATYRCSFDSDTGAKTWVRGQDCSQSQTAGCTCRIVDGNFATCTVETGSGLGSCY